MTRRLPTPEIPAVDDLLDLCARAMQQWHGQPSPLLRGPVLLDLTDAEIHQLGEGASMEIDRLQRAEHEAVQATRDALREGAQLQTSLDEQRANVVMLTARVTELSEQLYAEQAARERAERSATALQREVRALRERLRVPDEGPAIGYRWRVSR